MFGATPPPQNEDTPFYPRSPYGAAKVYSYWITKNYREAYGLFAVNGILFNHESPRRGETFVTRKITRAVARIKAGVQKDIYLGNLDAIRDWGYAAGVRRGHVADAAGRRAGRLRSGHGCADTRSATSWRPRSIMSGLDWQKYVRFDERYLRPTEVDALIGDPAKAADKLGWVPTIDGKELAKLMVDADIEALEKGAEWIDTVKLASLGHRDDRHRRCELHSGANSTGMRRSTSPATAGSSGPRSVRRLESAGFDRLVGKTVR